MWKSNVKNIFHISCLPVGVSTGQNTWYPSKRGFLIAADCAITYHFMPAHSQQSEWQNIIARTHTWQQCSVSTSEAILTTKYGFNLRQNSPLNIKNNTGYSGWIRVCRACANRSARFHWSWHTFEATYAGSIPCYSCTFRYMTWVGPGKQS